MVFKKLLSVAGGKGSQKGKTLLAGETDQARSDAARGLSKLNKKDMDALYKAQAEIRGLAAKAKMQVKTFRKKNPNNKHVQTIHRLKPEIKAKDLGSSTSTTTTTTKVTKTVKKTPPTKTELKAKFEAKKKPATTKAIKKEVNELAKTGTPTKSLYDLGKVDTKNLTATQKTAMQKFKNFTPSAKPGTVAYDREINKASAELAKALGKTSASGKKYTRKKRRRRRITKKNAK